jgi:solute:Na+ symporter, SSS family
MGATPQLSWIGVLGYSSGSAVPAMLICYLGPMVRSMCTTKAFSTSDFGRQRYGRIMQFVVTCVSSFYMFIFIVAELTAISNIFALLTNNFSAKYRISVSIVIGVFTTFYTTIAGTPASIVTDKFQAFMMASLVVLLTLAVTTHPQNAVTPSEFAKASNWTLDGLTAAVTLVIAIACAELFNQGNWQRVWAAESIPALKQGFCMGSIMVFFLMMFFGVMGMLAYANDPDSYDNGEKYAYLSFFDLLLPLKQGWHILTLILVTALAASTIDTLQNGMASFFSRDVMKVGWNPQWVARILIVVINIPAIYLASKAYSVISLFLVADLVCATSVFPVYCGLQTKDRGILTAPTELGALLGCIAGIFTVLMNGLINHADGGIFEYFWLRNNSICSLCGTKTMVTFIITPLFSLFATYFFSYMDLWIRGDRARQSLINFAFDDDDKMTVFDGDEKQVSPDADNDKNASYDVDDTVKKVHDKFDDEELCA